MKGLKSLRLPNWIIKSIQFGKENDDLGSIIVNLGVFYLMGLVAFFVYSPFGNEYLTMEIICAIGVFFLIAMFGYWLIGQVTLLDTLRKEAIILYKNSKTQKQKQEAISRLEVLYVPIPQKNPSSHTPRSFN